MKGRHYFLLAGFIFATISLFTQYFPIKQISTTISLLTVGIYLGISIKSMEINYNTNPKRIERKNDEEEFLKALEVD